MVGRLSRNLGSHRWNKCNIAPRIHRRHSEAEAGYPTRLRLISPLAVQLGQCLAWHVGSAASPVAFAPMAPFGDERVPAEGRDGRAAAWVLSMGQRPAVGGSTCFPNTQLRDLVFFSIGQVTRKFDSRSQICMIARRGHLWSVASSALCPGCGSGSNFSGVTAQSKCRQCPWLLGHGADARDVLRACRGWDALVL